MPGRAPVVGERDVAALERLLDACRRAPASGCARPRRPSRRRTTPAYGERRPSRSSDQNGALRWAGSGTVMWLGTTSTMMPSPASRQAVTSRWNASRPPASSRDAGVVEHVVAVHRARRGLQHRRQVEVRDPERREVGRVLGRRVEPEPRVDLQAVGRRGDRRGRGRVGERWASSRPVGRARLRRAGAASRAGCAGRSASGAATLSLLPASCHSVSTTSAPVSISATQRSPHSSSGRMNASSSWSALKMTRKSSSSTRRPRESGVGDGLAVEEDHHGPGLAVGPGRLAHRLAGGLEPGDVAQLGLAAVVGAAGEEAAAAEHRRARGAASRPAAVKA